MSISKSKLWKMLEDFIDNYEIIDEPMDWELSWVYKD